MIGHICIDDDFDVCDDDEFSNEFDLDDVLFRLSDFKVFLLLPWANIVGLTVNIDVIKINPKIGTITGSLNLYCLMVYLILNKIQ